MARAVWPRTVTIGAGTQSVRDGGGRVGHRIIMYFGLALALLVGLFTLWGGLSLGGLTRLGIPEILKYWSIPLLIALGLTFFSVLAKRKPPTKRCSSAAAVAAGVFVLGGYAVLFMETTGVLRLATVSTSAILVGVGYGLLSLVWQHRLSSLAFDDVVKTLLFALVIQSAGYLLLFALLQDRTWMVFPFLVALAVVFCLITLRLPKSNEDRRTNSKRRKGALKSAVAELSDPLLCVCAIAFAVALTRAITLDGIERTDAINLIASGCIIVVALALYGIWFVLGDDRAPFKKLSILGLYRAFFPIIVTALLALSIVGNSLALSVATLVYVLFTFVSVFIMSTSISVARAHSVPATSVYGAFAGATYFVFAAATALGAWVYYPRNFGAATLSVIVLFVFYILAMSYAAIQARKKRRGEDATTRNPVEAKATVVDGVSERCAVLSQQHGLTARENDTLLLLAKGRDVPSIAKQLFISENTVRSHSKSIYKKLDIHSKQELLDLLETIELAYENDR